MRFRLVLFCTALAALGATSLESQTRVLTGRVVDASTGAGLAGAGITVAGSAARAFAGQDGSFNLNVPVGGVELTVRRIGFRDLTISVPAGQSDVTFALDVDALMVDAVVVTGLATDISRRNLANAVAVVQGDAVRQVTSQSVEHALQGKVLGAYIQTNSGAPGGGAQVRMRGITSINATASPLWVIDGIIVSDVSIPSNQNVVSGASSGNNPALTQDGQVNRIVDMNPEDIESIEVLKGASASAIYGSKASNGVIIVTTRRGTAGAPRLNVRQRFGFFDLSNKLGFRTFETVAEFDALRGAGAAAATGFQPGVTFDLEEALAGRNALSHETAFDVSGGSADTRYFISGLWQDDEGIMANTGFAKQSLRLNLDQQFGDRVSASVSTNLIHTNARRGLTNNDNNGVSPYMVWAFTYNSFDLSQRADGSFPDNPFQPSNPLATLAQMENDEDVWRILSSGQVDWNLFDGERSSLTLLGLAGVDYFQQKNRLFFPPELQFEDDDGFAGTSLLSNSDNLNVNLNASAVHTYDLSGGNTALTTSAGVQYQTQDLDISRIESRGLTAGQPNVSAGSNVNVRQQRERVENLGFFLQEEVLTLDDRLLLTAGIRADQSSVNADDTELYYFPKASASWRIPDLGGGFLDEIKFRAAYGESGNLPLYGDRFTPLEATNVIGGVAGTVIPVSNLDAVVGSPTLKPERQQEVEAGIDATLLDRRASLELNVYQKNISDLIVRRRLAPSSGFGEEVFNGGKLRTRGVEVGLGITAVQSQSLNWFFRTSFFLNRSEITQLDVPSFLPGSTGFGVGLGQIRIEEGMSATQMVGNIGQDAAGSPIEGVVGDVNPDFNVGFTNDLSYNNFGFYFHLDWQQGGDIMNLTKLLYDLGSNWAGFNEPDQQGLTGAQRNAMSPIGGSQQTGIYVEEATFLKMRELTLSYELDSDMVSSIWGAVDRVSLTLSGRNLLTFTKYTGIDPEVSNFGNQPSGRNIDVAPFPPSRSFWLGIDVGF